MKQDNGREASATQTQTAEEVVHWISAEGNVTACGKRHVFPMRGNGWRVRDITCPDCDRAIVDALDRIDMSRVRATLAKSGAA